MQELTLGRTCVQMDIITPLRSCPCEELEALNFWCFATVPEEVLSGKFSLDSTNYDELP